MPNRRTLACTLVISGLVAVLLAGCGGGPERLSKDEFFSKVVTAEAKAGSAQVALTLSSPGGQKVTSKGEMKVGSKPADTALAMTMGGGAQSQLGSVEVRLVDRAFYVRLGALTGNKFAKIDLTNRSNPIAREYGGLIENLDPGRQVRQFRTAVEKFDNSGDPVKIDGVETVPYKVTVNPAKTKQFAKSGTNPVSFTLYVGPDQLPRRMVSAANTDNGSTAVRTDYSHWGDPVTITAPSKSQIETGGPLGQLDKLGGS